MIDRLSRNPLALAGAVLLAALVGAAAMWGLQRVAPGRLGVTDTARVEAVVREYVLAHPELIPEAMDRLRDRQMSKLIDANHKAILEPFGGAWIGNPKGDVTLVEYYDYNCGYCRASLPAIAELVARDPKVKIVFREFPILSEESIVAAKLSLAAAEQGKFKAFHDALYAGGQLTPEHDRSRQTGRPGHDQGSGNDIARRGGDRDQPQHGAAIGTDRYAELGDRRQGRVDRPDARRAGKGSQRSARKELKRASGIADFRGAMLKTKDPRD